MTIKDENEIDPSHRQTQGLLRTVGPLVLGVGLLFAAVGFISFFSAFGNFDGPPRYFWCAFIGLPLIAIGSGMCKFAYLGAFSRYVMGEFAPVQRDTFNHLAKGTHPGVEILARAVGQGFAAGAGTRGAERALQCPRCEASNDASARFCSQCGASLEDRICSACGQSIAADARFCDECGTPIK